MLRAGIERLPDWASEALQLSRWHPGSDLGAPAPRRRPVALYVVNHLPRRVRRHPAGDPEDLHGFALLDLARAVRRGGRRQQPHARGRLRAARRSPASLGVPSRYPLVYIQSVTRDATGKPIDCYRAWLRTDRLRIAVETDTWASLAGRVVSHSFVGVPNDDAVLGS